MIKKKNLLHKIRYTIKKLLCIHQDSNKSLFFLFYDFIRLKKRIGLSIDEYTDFEFEQQPSVFRNTFLTRKEQCIYLNVLNPRKYYIMARNKYFSHLLFETRGIRKAQLYCYYHPEGILQDETIACNYSSIVRILKAKQVTSCVIKPVESSHGSNVIVVNQLNYEKNTCMLYLFNGEKIELKELLKRHEPLLFESIVQQTEQFQTFNASSVNTVRFMTTLNPDGKAQIIALWMKFGKPGVCVDNAGDGGNISAAVDIESGRIYNVTLFDGWRKTKPITHHPANGVLLEGTIIENWEHIKNDVLHFQESIPYLKAIGWDIAITPEGALAIEMNDFWDRTGQLFIHRGWKYEIKECYLKWKQQEESKMFSI